MEQLYGQKQDKDVFRRIFSEHWGDFKDKHPAYDCDQYNEPVKKMLGCGKESGGYCEYICMQCGLDLRRICFSCKGCFCLSCAKVYVDNMVSQVSKMLHPGVIYRHVVLTVPSQLRQYFYDNRHDSNLLSEFMRTGHKCLEDVLSTVKRQVLEIGSIIVVQTHGRSGHYNPHLHIIMTNGGVSSVTGNWVNLGYFPYHILHKKWQYYLLNMVDNILGKAVKNVVNFLWKKFSKGFVAYVTKGKVPEKCKGLAKYLAKYVAAPPIAVGRILKYDGIIVTYWYKDHETKKKKVETVDVFTFIGRMVQHIMPKGFKRIRYYGLQAIKSFKKWCDVIKEGIRKIGQIVKGAYQVVVGKGYRERYKEISGRDPMICRHCGSEMELWKIWHPKYGLIYDEEKRIKEGKYDGCKEDEGRGGHSVRGTSKGIQLSLFPVQA